ncbi:2-oxo-4-hydroxy-4-carboxy-5-ureidoimidazoline decarboxylase-like [Amphiura filiformis]|uniref:2-oxo-4-hydroxy-4-carboxy-5-ureidoimidazoline decarboxylase-like n=1 Tax=Amphiura filiformis TaxID=82378 RepID=UPI003B224866
MPSPKSIEEVNQMQYEQFMHYLGNIVEEAPWVTSSIWSCRPFNDAKELHHTVCTLLDEVPLIVKESVLRGHPDLAGKLAQQNQLTPESTREQAAAGLPDLTPEKGKLISEFNQKYKAKFDFPFVICARENKVESIMKGLQIRVENCRETEAMTGISEIKKICGYRIADLLSTDTDSKM